MIATTVAKANNISTVMPTARPLALKDIRKANYGGLSSRMSQTQEVLDHVVQIVEHQCMADFETNTKPVLVLSKVI